MNFMRLLFLGGILASSCGIGAVLPPGNVAVDDWQRYQKQWSGNLEPRYEYTIVNGRYYLVHRPYVYDNPRLLYDGNRNGQIYRYHYQR